MRDFKVGDRVSCQAISCGSTPRWDFDDDLDRDGDGDWIDGTVTFVLSGAPKFEVTFDSGIEWTWTQPSYTPERYELDGYLILVESEQNEQVATASVKNNDGRDACFSCGAPTRKCGGLLFTVDYRICTKCGR